MIGGKTKSYKLIVVTLTLSSAQLHSDRIIKSKLLQPMLRIMRNKWNVVNYIWKAESQNNGNIHFHITIDKFIPWRDLRSTWNTLQDSLDYVKRSNIMDPNSTDIHAAYKAKNIAGYIAGYIGKKDLYKDSKEYENWSEHYYKDLLNITACDLKSREEVAVKRVIEGKIYDSNTELKSINTEALDHEKIQSEKEQLRSNGNWFKEDGLYKVTAINSTDIKHSPTLKYILDTSIQIAYGLHPLQTQERKN